MKPCLLTAACLLLVIRGAAAQTLEVIPAGAASLIATDAPMLTFNNARPLIQATLGSLADSVRPPITQPNFHAIVHVVKWRTQGTDHLAAAVEQWAVFRQGEWSQSRYGGSRLLGSTDVVLLTVHVDLPAEKHDALRYDISYEDKIAAPVSNLATLIGAIVQRPDTSAVREQRPGIVWGWQSIRIDRLPADITIKPRMLDEKGMARPFGTEKVFDNEGLYRYDFSVAVPITGAKDLTIEEGAGTASPVEVDRKRAYGTIMWYFRPTDVKAAGPSATPYLLAGLALEGKGFRRGLLGFGWGPALANFFAGAAWQRLDDDVAAAAGKRLNWSFTVGVNVPVRSLVDAATSK